ncbi:MAG: hypothetical protein K0Q68_2577 [Moraxellaceae bacterium]|nr:hypothetical protein [Moraxellaceae bacterium]
MNENKKGDVLKAGYFSIAKIDVHVIRQMYQVFSQYYENTTWDVFLQDLSKKTGAFIMRNSAGRVVGFSTVMTCKVMVGGRPVNGVFSGDTILERAYWGSRALQLEFFKFLVAEKARHPFNPVYWFLISKGFKTYLLLANNFYTFYPRHDGHASYLGDIVDAYCEQMFPAYYNRERRLLDFGHDYSPLRSDVAEITDRMREDNPSIRYFEDLNPEWRRGTELPCVGELRWVDLMKFTVRYATKPASKGRLDAEGATPAQAQSKSRLKSVVALRSVGN